MSKILLGFGALVVVYIAWSAFSSESPKRLEIDQNEWWGPNELKGKQDTSIRPFKVQFIEEMIKDLRNRLKNHRPFTPPLEGIAFQYGFNTKAIEPWLKFWAEEYPFKEREAFFNKFPHYKTNIQGLDIHFMRIKPQVPAGVDVVPLIILHGWPGSVREFYEAIPLLTQQQPGYNFAFEVIAPSLPGFGFSDAPVRPGLSTTQMAVIFKNLMTRLGFKKFYIQGGDWGSTTGSAMATLYPEDVLGYHTNMAITQGKQGGFKTMLGAFFPSLVVESHLADRMYPLSDFFAYLMEEFGYFHIQATKPDTVGVALTDSPSGLLAYILEKYSTNTNRNHRKLPDGGLERRFTKTQLIDNLMVYWSTNRITTSIRLYAEDLSTKNRQLEIDDYTTPVPTWAFQAKYEGVYQPPSILKTKYINLLGTTVLEDGGHFLAFELPEIFVKDVFKAVDEFKNWHKNESKNSEL
ncbi:PREDICTED: juvenile hormone epoxide hydrolase-like [Papilio xuthus]|uniref:Epoxide hydrolase n=1 Tax=Papilio xuthus TaxID=66420 RepID=A0AAJ7E6X8_PAPXU|nr:PREDICTED: juvenile hormone epoxide hydrolase-like [Papilio xuthus]XP_013165401.1 PREDICTED: juvenile hormone epoxide hydrolase-like [Papilio xuthus]